MTLQLHNSLTRKKEEFVPLDPEHIRMYVCGPTVYDQPHIGNARAVVVYDVLYRLLKQLYPKVTFVRNITDVDDKIIKAAKENGESIADLTKRITDGFHADMEALGNLPPDIEPRATEHIPHMIKMIEQLIEHGNAYESEGHVLFSVSSIPPPACGGRLGGWCPSESSETNDSHPPLNPPPQAVGESYFYGKLSGKKLDDLIAGARVDVESYKKDSGDFILWKPANEGDDESCVFDSPWGKGRPGWHIECSAMSNEYLGENFDIHGGGADLKFPHHENEIAQSTCANKGSHFAKYWIHNGFLTVNGEKMAKSEGNFITVRELLDQGIPGEVIRFILLSTKYNEPLDWSERRVGEAKKVVKKILKNFYHEIASARQTIDRPLPTDFINALCDDLNTPKAISQMHQATPEELSRMIIFLGLEPNDPEYWFPEEEFDENISVLVKARSAAKADKNFEKADKIRDELLEQGIILEDHKDKPTTWRKA